MQNVWVVKTCLSQGIRTAKVLQKSPFAILVRVDGQGVWPAFDTALSICDYAETREDAVIKAEKMRVQKIKWLRSQLTKLEKLRFE